MAYAALTSWAIGAMVASSASAAASVSPPYAVVAKNGSDGKSSTIAEYTKSGKLVRTISVRGHNDGLRLVGDGELWALQTEDANPTLVVIDLYAGKQTLYKFPPTRHGGGYHENPTLSSQGENVFPALVRAKLWTDKVVLETMMAAAWTGMLADVGRRPPEPRLISR
jgi:hypothetical protein